MNAIVADTVREEGILANEVITETSALGQSASDSRISPCMIAHAWQDSLNGVLAIVMRH